MNTTIESHDEYLNVFLKYVALVTRALTYYETQFEEFTKSKEKKLIHELELGIPYLISLVNTAGYFAGEGSVFNKLKPEIRENSVEVTDIIDQAILIHSQDLINHKDHLEKRLHLLIEAAIRYGEPKTYEQILNNYYVKSWTDVPKNIL